MWVGNGAGPATFWRIEDRGGSASEPRHFGGRRDGNLVDPWMVAVSDEGRIFAYDHGRRAVVACDEDGSDWRTAQPVPRSKVEEFVVRYRRFFSGIDFDSRNNIVTPTSLAVDNGNRRLYVNYRPGWPLTEKVLPFQTPSPGYKVYDFDLRELPVEFPDSRSLGSYPVGNRFVSYGHYSGDFFAHVAADGTLYQAIVGGTRHTIRREDKFVEALITRSADGTIKKRSLVETVQPSGCVTVDSKGNIYLVDYSPDLCHWFRGELNFGFPNWTGYEGGGVAGWDTICMYRGKMPVYHQPQVIDLVKFGPEGGRRYRDEVWAHRGAGYNGKVCGCKSNANTVACDGADRIMALDPTHYAVKILDTAGNLIQRVGCHGNAETLPGPDRSAKDIGFRIIQNVAAAGGYLYVVDRGLRRVAKVKMAYREVESTPLE